MLTFRRASITAVTALATVTICAPAFAGTTAPIALTPSKATVAAVMGSPVTTTVTVRNRTARPLRAVVVRVAPPPGVVAGIVPGGARYVVIARLAPRAARSVRIRILPGRVGLLPVTVRGVVARRAVTVRITVTSRAASTTPAPNPGTATARLAGRAYFHTLPLGSAKDLEVVAFGAGGLAHHEVGGFTTPGFPVCTEPSNDGSGNGCRPYTDDGTTITLDGQPVQLTSTGIQVGAVKYDEVAPLAAGTRVDMRLEYIHQVGFCPGPLCSFLNSDLLMVGDGRFIMTAGAMGIGSDPNLVDWTAVGADQKGTYVVDTAGRIILSFASGTVDRRFAGMFRNAAGAFDPAAGLLLGSRPYFKP